MWDIAVKENLYNLTHINSGSIIMLFLIGDNTILINDIQFATIHYLKFKSFLLSSIFSYNYF